ncbi:hypothetical protein [Spirosoma sp. KCTC 42546]|uniref:hypothetical protein n=1 Tax=Spirosoma sp. KCTC 42546 TaxID=2520506 RepID=UPI00143CDE3F|nr:hypothetical protein [Spirosoma sp. KCTC 42546]
MSSHSVFLVPIFFLFLTFVFVLWGKLSQIIANQKEALELHKELLKELQKHG